jgi:hypothetical protein
MRPVLPLLLVASVGSGCNCSKGGADVPTPVTLRFTNSSSAPVFVDATDAEWGLVVAPDGASETDPPYPESIPPGCTCLTCEAVCSLNGCPGQQCRPQVPTDPLVERLDPGDAVQRTWTGVYIQTSSEGCGSLVGGQACLQSTNDFPDDTFTARICYALSVTGGQAVDAGVPFPGTLPTGDLVCTQKSFQPQNGAVDLAPPPPQACNVDAGPGACPAGQLCFSGLCSSGCPLNDFPPYGNGYYVSVSAPSGPFFTVTPSATGTSWQGTGTLTSVSYGGTTFLALSRSGGLSGTIDYTLPQLGTDCCLEAFHTGETLQVTVVETPSGSGNRALVIRDASGQLLQVADMATEGPILGAADTAPFTVTPLSDALGCSSVAPSCKAIYADTRFTAADGPAPTLSPGQLADATTSGANFRALNVQNIAYQSTVVGGTTCSGFTSLTPYVILNTRP